MSEKKSIRLIALDLDGTLLDSEKRLSAANRAALERAVSMGIEVVPATGRFYDGMPEVIRELPFVRYVITVNGAQVFEVKTRKNIYSADIELSEAIPFYEKLDTLPVIYDCYMDGWGYMTGAMQERVDDFVSDPHTVDMVLRLRKPVPELKSYLLENGRPVQKIQLFTRDITLRDRLIGELAEEYPQFSVTSSLPNNIEVNSVDADKGKAIRALAEYLGMDVSQTAAFGDGRNDVTMLAAAGIGVAMENACGEAKAAADMVTASCDEDGVAKAIGELLN
ncbi:MAG: HAD family phosphatase [Firmicutes bacterium]|nr:HAD family phosphatase [Bacillota bacterium]